MIFVTNLNLLNMGQKQCKQDQFTEDVECVMCFFFIFSSLYIIVLDFFMIP